MNSKRNVDPAELERQAVAQLIMIGYAIDLGATVQQARCVREYLERFGARIPRAADRDRDGAAIEAVREAARIAESPRRA